ncbi:MAG: hypothetical protein HXK70_03520 [Clostridiales bacterium]|nr:hypothetical protein [Clostridiales bacterium]
MNFGHYIEEIEINKKYGILKPKKEKKYKEIMSLLFELLLIKTIKNNKNLYNKELLNAIKIKHIRSILLHASTTEFQQKYIKRLNEIKDNNYIEVSKKIEEDFKEIKEKYYDIKLESNIKKMNYLTKGYYDFNGETSLSYTYAICKAIKYIKQIEEGKTKSFSTICLMDINQDITEVDIKEMIEYLLSFD